MGTSVKLSYQELCVVVAPELSKDLRLGCNVAICVEDTDAHWIMLIVVSWLVRDVQEVWGRKAGLMTLRLESEFIGGFIWCFHCFPSPLLEDDCSRADTVSGGWNFQKDTLFRSKLSGFLLRLRGWHVNCPLQSRIPIWQSFDWLNCLDFYDSSQIPFSSGSPTFEISRKSR